MTLNKTILLLITLIPTLMFGQVTKKISNKETKENFYVLKTDNNIKHGEYKKFSFSNKLIIKGFYKQGVRDSIWECYDDAGQIILKYDYKKSELVFYKPNNTLKNKKYKVINNGANGDTTLSRPPIYLGGDDYVLSELVSNIRYPGTALENGISGTVFVSFTVDKIGKTSNYHVDTPLGYGLDEEAIRVLKLFPDNWLPGLVKEQMVDVEVVYPIKFTLN